MSHSLLRHLSAPALLLLLVAPALAQGPEPASKRKAAAPQEQFRDYFKKPETPAEYWAAVNFEINVGRYELARDYLRGLMASKPSDQDLLQLVDEEGISSFLRLLTIPELRKDAQPLVDQVTGAQKKLLSDPDRIQKFIANLTASREERTYAISQLRRSGATAVPYLIRALQAAPTANDRQAILTSFLYLSQNALPPLEAALEAQDPNLQLELMAIMQERRDPTVIPFLWHLTAAPNASEGIHRRSRQVIASLLGVPEGKLPAAKVALTAEAEKYATHRVKWSDPEQVQLWYWEGKRLLTRTATPSEAEEFYGLKFARQALEIDPTYEPAQIVFLSLALGKAVERAGYDQPLSKAAPSAALLVRLVNPALLNTILDRALTQHDVPVILGAARALGEFGDVRALQPTRQREPALERALYDPDRRVHFAAAEAILRIPPPENFALRPRIVEILREALLTEPHLKALIGDFDTMRGHDLGRVLQGIGYQPIVVATGRQLLARLRQVNDVDVVLVDASIPDPQLPFLLAQLRADVNFGSLPVLIMVPPDAHGDVPGDIEGRLLDIVHAYRNVWLIPATTNPTILQRAIADHIADAQGRPFLDEERKQDAAVAMLWLRRLAVGEVPGYDIRPAQDAIFKALTNDELAPLAIEAAGKLPNREAQRELANVVFRANRPELQAAAATQLARHIQHYDLTLTPEQIQGLIDRFKSATDPRVQSALALVMGSLRPDARLTGATLEGYRPEAPRGPALVTPPPEK